MIDSFPQTDDLDRQIAEALAEDARLSFRKIAVDLGVTEGTVRGRVKRLQSAGLLKLVPIVDIARGLDATNAGQHMMFVTVKCASGKLDAVREGLLALPQVRALYDANAALRLIAICVLPSLDDAAAVTNQVLALDGIREAETELVLQTVKYNAAIGPIATVEDLRGVDRGTAPG
ncbi:Lrp/AsnC family transcriptional regulator (plasmid) [Novosphingobium sp. THN1]|jgi:DNA-binding Lrp family transcriptional regulator|uniref:Lrp/AsnC family transcriptional regulator n=1 Tax=unclassified Novosphingobium TaxID=2644732 RepID=UPI000E504324|nr:MULTISPECIES: Lrp/AsnC family transcriptional regulator [unclassified Novosphingobium]AXU21241.1 Lrp/AsnC family transcriptional regulator [Novosphingobium sp. THN1]NLR39788.1 Lrp/AsnC family transcriptional regulator [Novosphingobium sp. ERW19]TXI07434.1 MAG: Lrp/AsnC family transcriptional regulator [Novosphingobium sp.]